MKLNFQNKLIALVLVVITIIGGASFYLVYSISVENSRQEANMFYERFQNSLAADHKALEVALTSIIDRSNFQEAYLARDKDLLLKLTQGHFQELKEKFDITHLYFHNIDTTNYLRVHKTHQSGDKITRYTLKNAIQENKMVGGLETGKTAFAYRVVSPVNYNGKLIGYQEVGQEIDKILEQFKASTQADITFMMKKELVSEELLAQAEGTNDAVIYASTDKDLAKTLVEKAGYKVGESSQTIFKPIITHDGNFYFYLVKEFKDASGQAVGDIIITGSAAKLVQASKTVALVIISITLLMIAATLLITKTISRPVEHLLGLMERAKEGDLTVEGKVYSSDELGQVTSSFNEMMVKLRTLIGEINSASQQVAASSEELTASAQETTSATQEVANTTTQLASGATKQAEEAEETRAVVSRMSHNIDLMREHTDKVSQATIKVLEVAGEGSLEAENAVNKIERIKEVSTKTSEVVKALGQESEQIGQIVDVIKGIADQTNLLALNAAIEAARAGEQGRGFAVVAEEVRKLAEQSSKSAEQIAGLIGNIQNETLRAVEVMEIGTKEVDKGVIAVNKAGGAFKVIVAEVEKVVEQINDVGTAARQIADGSRDVVRSIENIAAIAEDTAAASQEVSAASEQQNASMEEVAGSAEELANLAEQLQAMIAKFRH